MESLKNFFIKVWEYIKKAFNVSVEFLKENIWATVLSVILAIILLIMGLQGIIKAIDSCENETIQNRATVVTSSQIEKMFDEEKTFVLFIGSQNCSHCKEFYKTINTYIKSTGKEIFYFDVDDTTDPGSDRYTLELQDMILSAIPEDRGIKSLSTPTTIRVEDGVIVDAIQGAYGMEGGTNYLIFCEVIEGAYVGKDTYTNKLQGTE